MVNPLKEAFPGLARGGYRTTSPTDKRYNCIAWAARDTGRWWWPVPDSKETFWPSAAAPAETLTAFRDAFASLGFVVCEGDETEPGFERIAVFANDRGIPLHAARQLPNGRWTSKLGELEDIEHALHDLEGAEYGSVVQLMKRPRASTAASNCSASLLQFSIGNSQFTILNPHTPAVALCSNRISREQAEKIRPPRR